ncbi:class I SAM-dependent methyltransferase [Paenibacillus sp. MBLB4367]
MRDKETSTNENRFNNDSFDLVMANFMLYHFPDIEKAVRELKGF